MSTSSLDGKTVIVTGSTSGIGQEMAHAFAEAGANVMLNGLGDAAEIEKDRSALEKKASVQVEYHPANMLKPDEIEDMITSAQQAFGSVDILVNNAGIQYTGAIDGYPVDKWDAIIGINLSAAFHATRAALPHMKKQQFGRIINIASVHGLVGSANKGAYVAAKHGLIGLTKVTALEVADFGITANTICPGWTYTPLVEKQVQDKSKELGLSYEETKIKMISEKQAYKDYVKVEELASMALYLASDAAKSITGANMVIDGGWTAQ